MDAVVPTHAGQVFENPVTGERAVVRIPPTESNGHRLVADLWARPGAAVVGEHAHPGLTECLTVVRGQLWLRHAGRERVAEPGTRVEITPGVVHDWWNAGTEEAHIVVEVQPAERFGQLVRHLFFLAQDGKTNARGMPHALQGVLLADEFSDTVRFTKPPWFVQRLAHALLGPIARWQGYRGFYPEYMQRGPSAVIEVEPLPPEIAKLIPGISETC